MNSEHSPGRQLSLRAAQVAQLNSNAVYQLLHSPPSIAVRRTTLLGAFAVVTIFAAVLFVRPAFAEKPSENKSPAAAAPTKAPTSEDIVHWIKDLSHDAFSVRQEAASQLLAAGMAARQPLIELAEGPDPETRAAARRIVSLIDRSEFRRRLDAFAADTEGKSGLTLPGWDRFQKLVGSDPSARALFVDMQRQEGTLLSSIFGATKRPPEELWEPRLLRLAQWPGNVVDHGAVPPIGSCATMLFLGSLPEMNVSNQASSFVKNIIERPPVKDLVQPDSPQPAVRKLAVTWILQCPNPSEDVLRERLNTVAAMGLKEALPLAVEVSSGDPKYLHIQPLTKAMAILIVGQLGSRDNIDKLQPALEDTTVCLPPQVQVPGQPASSVQVRDVALAVMLNLTEQAPSDYGYTSARMAQPRMFLLQSLVRENDQQRTESISKWRTWRAVHKDDAKTPKKLQPIPN